MQDSLREHFLELALVISRSGSVARSGNSGMIVGEHSARRQMYKKSVGDDIEVNISALDAQRFQIWQVQTV